MVVVIPPRASDLLSDDAGRLLLETQLSSDAEHITAALAQVQLASPLVSLGLLYAADEELASVSYVYGWTETARNAAFAADPERALWTLWSPSDWDVDYDDVVAPPEPTEVTHKLTHLLMDESRDDYDPAGAFLMDLAYRLNRSPLPVEVTPDFACWVTEHEMDDEPWLWMTQVARPEVIEQYASRGWLRTPDEF